MAISVDSKEVLAVLHQFNAWWRGFSILDVPDWHRPALQNVVQWLNSREVSRSLVLTGARQVGKTTLFRQAIRHLLQKGIPPTNIIYATFDHPLLKLVGHEKVLQLWRDNIMPPNGDTRQEFVFFDELQCMPHWATWLKHQTDFYKHMRIAVTGSSLALLEHDAESGVGRWMTLWLPTMTFYEYLQFRKEDPLTWKGDLLFLKDVAEISASDRTFYVNESKKLQPYFHEYLIRGGFPECAKNE